MEQNQLLDEFQPEWVHASHGKRLLNAFIDIIGYYLLLLFITIPISLFSTSLFEPDEYGNTPIDGIGWNIAVYVLYLVYYILFEGITGGRTLGKLITGTKAIREDGSNMGWGTVIKRNLIRFVPFEIFSYFGTPCQPWHDSWSDTMVIDVKKSNALKF